MSATIERVVVPLDAATENRAAIETAARLAARARARLHGIFIEDEELLQVAALPFTRQLAPGVGAQPFTVEDTELHLKAAAEQARRELIAAARRHGLQASFEVVRSGPEAALSGISERDLVVAGALGRPIARHFRVECRWWSSIEVTHGPFLLTRRQPDGGPVIVPLRDSSPESARLLDVAAQVAEAGDGELTVVCPPALAAAADFGDWLAQRLTGFRVSLRVEVASGASAALYLHIGELGCRVLAIEAGALEGGTGELRAFVERFACDVLIVR
jgi:nucleotide-binding universal stress UspA family protein